MIKIKAKSRYSEYFDPNRQEWIKSIPKDWMQKRIGFNTILLTGFAFKSEQFSYDEGIRLVRGDNVTEGKLRWGNKERLWPLMGPEYENVLLQDGDILIGMDGSKVGKNYAMVSKKDLPLLLVQRVARLRTDVNLDPRFLYYCIGNKLFQYWIAINKTDPMVPHITPKDITNYEIAFPSIEEQTRIARFLDQKTGQIDRLIGQKEKLLKLLAEKRTAIITQAVTKGLDPNVEMKDSGVDWLGEIPKEWEIKPLKFVVNLINEKLDELGDLTYLGLEHIVSWTSKRIVDEDAKADGVVTRFQPNDVLFGKLRPYLAKVYLADFEGGASTEALILRSGSEVVPAFLKYYLVSDLLIDVINSSTYGSKMPRASWNFIGRLPMILPNTDIQIEIVEYLISKIEKFDVSISKINKSINQLKEYREALITSAVTGQVDVRKEIM